MAERYLRAQIAYSDSHVQVDFVNKLIRGASVITRGVALGHGGWIDKTFIKQVGDQGNSKLRKDTEEPIGLKSRFAHPSLSGDGLGDYLGRTKQLKVSGDRVRGDLHFGQSADPEKVGMILQRAIEDPEAFGMSIVFEHDKLAEEEFAQKHRKKKDGLQHPRCIGCKLPLSVIEPDSGALMPYDGRLERVRCGGCGTENDPTFESPDTDNVDNLPHWRLKSIHAADVVDEPAANADGFLSDGQEFVTNLDSVLRYVLRLTDVVPTELALGRFSPEKSREFVASFLDRHNIELAPKKGGMVTCPKCGHEFDPKAEMSQQSEPEVPNEPEPAEEEAPAVEAPKTPDPAPPATDVPPGRERNEADVTVEALAQDAGALGAISYRKAHPNGTPLVDDKTATWDGGAETKAASVDDLRIMCAFVSDGRENLKTGYKLPHHRAGGQHACVFRGVSQAAARMDQVSDMTPGARRIVRGHLQEHYHEFGEKAPWERNSDAWGTYEQVCMHRSMRGGMMDYERAEALRMVGFDLEADALQDIVELTTVVAEASNGKGSRLTQEQVRRLNEYAAEIEGRLTGLTGRLI